MPTIETNNSLIIIQFSHYSNKQISTN